MEVSDIFVKNFIQKLYRFLETAYFDGHTLKITKCRGCQGWIKEADDNVTVTIAVDHRKQLLPTLIHEVLHYQYQDYSETKILELEAAIVNKLSQRRVKNILKRFSDAL